MPGFMSKIFKGGKASWDGTDLQFSPTEFEAPRYDAIRALAKKREFCEVWGDDALKRFGIPVESAHPNLLCLVVANSMNAPVYLMTSGWALVKGPTPEIEGMIADPFLNPSFLIRKPPKTVADDDSVPALDTTTRDNPLVCLISREKFSYRFSTNNPYKNVPSIPSYITGLMSRYVTLPHDFQRSIAVTLASLQQLYEGDHVLGLKDKKFEKNLPKEFRELHRALIEASDWKQFATKETQNKYTAIYDKVHEFE